LLVLRPTFPVGRKFESKKIGTTGFLIFNA
jgi:hypothetical protein